MPRSDPQSKVFGSNSLNYYNASSELKIIRDWYEMVKTPFDENSSMIQLEREAKETSDKPGTMAKYLKRAKHKYSSFSGLTRAECLVVMMYTDDNDDSAFVKEYNMASTNGNWQPYRVYTTLLMSALRELARTKPLPQGYPLYRGLSSKVEPPTDSRIFWKAFTSTSLEYHVAQASFAGDDGIVIAFQPPDSDQVASVHAAQVWELSSHPAEKEVILLPFEAFDILDADEFHFKTSKTQELLT